MVRYYLDEKTEKMYTLGKNGEKIFEKKKKKDSIRDIDVSILYECKNPKCKAQYWLEKKASDSFGKKCIFCKSNKIKIKDSKSSLSVFADVTIPTTFGSQGEKNYERLLKEREGDPTCDILQEQRRMAKYKKGLKIMKNPEYYIKTGKTV